MGSSGANWKTFLNEYNAIVKIDEKRSEHKYFQRIIEPAIFGINSFKRATKKFYERIGLYFGKANSEKMAVDKNDKMGEDERSKKIAEIDAQLNQKSLESCKKLLISLRDVEDDIKECIQKYRNFYKGIPVEIEKEIVKKKGNTPFDKRKLKCVKLLEDCLKAKISYYTDPGNQNVEIEIERQGKKPLRYDVEEDDNGRKIYTNVKYEIIKEKLKVPKMLEKAYEVYYARMIARKVEDFSGLLKKESSLLVD